MTDSSGDVTVSYTYDSYGNLIASTGTSDNTYGFTGEQQFGEADELVFLRARYYDPRIGRFISRDPRLSPEYYIKFQSRSGINAMSSILQSLLMKPQNLNPYVYATNNPVNLIDPTGGCSSEIPDEIADKVIDEVINKYGTDALKDLKAACDRHESGCGDMVDCQMCGDYKCLKKLPATLAAFHNCIKAEYVNCF